MKWFDITQDNIPYIDNLTRIDTSICVYDLMMKELYITWILNWTTINDVDWCGLVLKGMDTTLGYWHTSKSSLYLMPRSH